MIAARFLTRFLKIQLALSLLLAVIWFSLLALAIAVEAANIVANPGFETRTRWENWPRPWWAQNESKNWSRDQSAAHSGTWSFKVSYQSAQEYNLAGQQISITAGEFYQIGAWIKTQGVSGGGATIFIEWSGNGQWLGGEWGFRKIKGTADWQFVSLPMVQAPEKADQAIIYLELAKGSAGSAWFDDVIVERRTKPLLSSFILRPNYAYKILPDAPSPEIEVEVSLNLEESSLSLNQVKVAATLKDQTTKTIIIQKSADPPPSATFCLSLDLPPTAPSVGYDLEIVLMTKDGAQMAQNAYVLDKLSQDRFAKLTSYIDSHNRFILNGESFFPLGLYLGIGPQWGYSQVDEIADSPFDTIMNYEINSGNSTQITNYLNYLHSKGLKLIYSLKDYLGNGQADLDTIAQKVTAYRDHPAIISWYLNDESGLEYLPELEARYQKVRQLDENHPVWSVHYQKSYLIGEAHTTDILGVDPYPIPDRPITLVSEMADWAKEASRGGYRPLWLVPQIFDQSHYPGHSGRLPTPQEIRAMTYLATNHGAKGLIYYSYFDIRSEDYYQTHWAAIKKIANEIKSLRSIFLSIEETSDQDILCSYSSSIIDCKLMKQANSYYLFAVNTQPDEISGVSFQINLAYRPAIIDVLFENNRQLEVKDGRFTDNFSPYEVHIYKLDAPTLIELDQFTATPHSDRIIITFKTKTESEAVGFNLWRSEEEKGVYSRINPTLIEARGGATYGADYSFTDTAVRPGATYYYKLEEQDTTGTSVYGPVSATLPAQEPAGKSAWPSCFFMLPYFWPGAQTARAHQGWFLGYRFWKEPF